MIGISGLLRAAVLGAVVSLAGLSGAGAATIGFVSDADFLNNAGLEKRFGYNVRGGNGTTAGDWEYAVVNGVDIPIGGVGQLSQAQINAHNRFEFTFDGLSVAGLNLFAPNPNDPQNELSFGFSRTVQASGAANAVALRARAMDGGTATLSNLVINFLADNSFLNLGGLTGDQDAEYLMIVDSRIAAGFNIFGDVDFDRNGLNGSRVMYQAKVGVAPIPLPATLPLLALAFAGLGYLRLRRRGL